MRKNVKEIKTTIIGLLVWIISGLYFALPYFSDKDLWEVERYEVSIGFVGGLLLILAPDRLLDFLFGWLNKKK